MLRMGPPPKRCESSRFSKSHDFQPRIAGPDRGRLSGDRYPGRSRLAVPTRACPRAGARARPCSHGHRVAPRHHRGVRRSSRNAPSGRPPRGVDRSRGALAVLGGMIAFIGSLGGSARSDWITRGSAPSGMTRAAVLIPIGAKPQPARKLSWGAVEVDLNASQR